jgi:hypothetical protein
MGGKLGNRIVVYMAGSWHLAISCNQKMPPAFFSHLCCVSYLALPAVLLSAAEAATGCVGHASGSRKQLSGTAAATCQPVDCMIMAGLTAAAAAAVTVDLQVLVCTATLAWGVNLPAHTVIIKGTQVRTTTPTAVTVTA